MHRCVCIYIYIYTYTWFIICVYTFTCLFSQRVSVYQDAGGSTHVKLIMHP